MKKYYAAPVAFLSVVSVHAQQPPSNWDVSAPQGSMVYTDLKTAEKEAANVYRLDLSGAGDFRKDKKNMERVASLSNLMALRLGNNSMTQLPPVFLQLPSLVYFGSSGNAFTTFPDSIGMWSNLKYMELGNTAFDSLPVAIYGLPKLQELSVNRNADTLLIPYGISSMAYSLQEFKIYNTIIDSLPADFSSLDKLKKLVLYKAGFKIFPREILGMHGLNELYLDSNNISVLPRAIGEMKGLTYLSLRGNRLTHIPSTICFLQNLSVLDLRGNPLDPYEVTCLQALLPSCEILF
ncbi:MAG TPA: leucine-rich repeat domain-containing protein [Bacteroidia bacterium]|nr:leucine-rich repeat domain-containing protein [Bacteroidia bacterium]